MFTTIIYGLVVLLSSDKMDNFDKQLINQVSRIEHESNRTVVRNLITEGKEDVERLSESVKEEEAYLGYGIEIG